MRVGHLTSVEHDAGWAPAVGEAIGGAYDEEFLTQVPVTFCKPALRCLMRSPWAWQPTASGVLHVSCSKICKMLGSCM
jgi:hypothetical protein